MLNLIMYWSYISIVFIISFIPGFAIASYFKNLSTSEQLIDICFEGTESYPTEEPPPVEPPSIHQSQQERMLLIITLIKDNQNGRGASIEKVISEAVGKGIDKEYVLEYIERLKFQGEAYEPRNGEIRYVF
jgi:hypothetical protein